MVNLKFKITEFPHLFSPFDTSLDTHLDIFNFRDLGANFKQWCTIKAHICSKIEDRSDQFTLPVAPFSPPLFSFETLTPTHYIPLNSYKIHANDY